MRHLHLLSNSGFRSEIFFCGAKQLVLLKFYTYILIFGTSIFRFSAIYIVWGSRQLFKQPPN